MIAEALTHAYKPSLSTTVCSFHMLLRIFLSSFNSALKMATYYYDIYRKFHIMRVTGNASKTQQASKTKITQKALEIIKQGGKALAAATKKPGKSAQKTCWHVLTGSSLTLDFCCFLPATFFLFSCSLQSMLHSSFALSILHSVFFMLFMPGVFFFFFFC